MKDPLIIHTVSRAYCWNLLKSKSGIVSGAFLILKYTLHVCESTYSWEIGLWVQGSMQITNLTTHKFSIYMWRVYIIVQQLDMLSSLWTSSRLQTSKMGMMTWISIASHISEVSKWMYRWKRTLPRCGVAKPSTGELVLPSILINDHYHMLKNKNTKHDVL